MTLTEIIADLQTLTITVDGVNAELTRTAYYNQYSNYINTGQYVPILYFNVLENIVTINNTGVLGITNNDIFTANDWVCLNQTN